MKIGADSRFGKRRAFFARVGMRFVGAFFVVFAFSLSSHAQDLMESVAAASGGSLNGGNAGNVENSAPAFPGPLAPQEPGGALIAPKDPQQVAPSVTHSPSSPTTVAAPPSPPHEPATKDAAAKDTDAQDIKPIIGIGVPSSVKKTIKKLDGSTDSLTLEDLNAAREAVARLDVLLDIEKKLMDLAKIRGERGMTGSLAAAIPSSALPVLPMPALSTSGGENGASATPEKTGSVGDIVRIYGIGGVYTAICSTSSGVETKIRKGDEMEDGSQVVSISMQGVTVIKNGKTSVLKVKEFPHQRAQSLKDNAAP